MSGRRHGNDYPTQIPLAIVFAGIILFSTGARMQAQQRRVPPAVESP